MEVVHCKKQPYDVYIGRKNGDLPESIWANPFVIGKDGDREFVIDKYELYLNTRPDLLLKVKDLNEKILGCWCKPESCHGDILQAYSKSKWIVNWFSNMLPMDNFKYQGIIFNTSENFYQAMKLPKDRPDLRAEIAAMTPYKAKSAIRDKSRYLWREDWNKEESLKVMRYILDIKFAQPSWKRLLMMTDNWDITEWNNWRDLFWGKDIVTGEGENHLGKILMDIRNNL